MWLQREISLRARPRGFHLVTEEVVGELPEMRGLQVGLCHLFIRHTSASLTLNENASPDVRRDFGTWQGIYLCEHRDHGGRRSLLATLWGE